jgi:hypothetical protein
VGGGRCTCLLRGSRRLDEGAEGGVPRESSTLTRMNPCACVCMYCMRLRMHITCACSVNTATGVCGLKVLVSEAWSY